MKKINNSMILVNIAIIVLILVIAFFFIWNKYTYSVMDECMNMNDELLNDIESGKYRLTYECFGAKGDGKTNDYLAIKRTHDFANGELINKGIVLTVYGNKDSTYYIGNASESIVVATNVDWQNANFIIDDYILDSKGKNQVNISNSLFWITSPMYVETGKTQIEYNKNSGNVINYIETNTKNIKKFIDYVNNDSNIMNSDLKKYFINSRVWMLNVVNSNYIYIRSGRNENSGQKQSEMILVDSMTGDILTPIDWNYNDIEKISVFPIPNNNLEIKNGYFTTRTNNVYINSNGTSSKYTQRNIYVAYTGNIKLANIYHSLDETAHPYTNVYQTNEKANAYYGFIKLNNSAYINLYNIQLTPHSYDSNTSVGTYDLTFDNSVNLVFNNVGYYCNDINELCYNERMINKSVWGIVGSNTSKNVFFYEPKLNRIDAHRGITNLYIDGGTIGNYGLTALGHGWLYVNNVTFDRAQNVLQFRSDFGSSWDGNVLINNSKYIVDNSIGSPVVVSSNNNQTWNYGYQCYFPELYINNLDIDTSSISNKDITLLSLNENAISNEDENIKYSFNGNINFNNIHFINNNNSSINVFKTSFVNNNNNLNINNYGGNNKVNINYYTNNSPNVKIVKNDNTANKFKDSSINSKFVVMNSSKAVSIGDNISNNAKKFFDDLNVEMPKLNEQKIYLNNISISNGILNETFDSNRYYYSAFVPSDVESVTINVDVDKEFKVIGLSKNPIILSDGDNTISFRVTGIYGAYKDYVLTIIKSDNKVVFNDMNVNYDKKVIVDLNDGLLYKELLNNINTYGVTTVKSNNLMVNNNSDDRVKTGDEVVISFDNDSVSYNLAVLGDVSKDGYVNINDVTLLYRHFRKKRLLDNEYLLLAGDVTNDENIGLNDVTKVYRYSVGKLNSLNK